MIAKTFMAFILRGLFGQPQTRSTAEFLELFHQLQEQDKADILRFMRAFVVVGSNERA
jgi:hypothetical protein